MNKLQEIKKVIDNEIGVDISKKTRKRHIVYARYIFCKIAEEISKTETPRIPKRRVAYFIGLDHSTGLHALKRFEELKDYDDFSELYSSILSKLPQSIYDTSKKILTKEEKEIKWLYSNRKVLEKKIQILEMKLSCIQEDAEISALLTDLTKEKKRELIEYRMKPFCRLNGVKID